MCEWRFVAGVCGVAFAIAIVVFVLLSIHYVHACFKHIIYNARGALNGIKFKLHTCIL